MILKYLPICLFAFTSTKAQTALNITEQGAPVAFIEEAQPFAVSSSAPEAPPAPVAAPYYSGEQSRTRFYVNFELGFFNKTSANYGGISTNGGGSRYGVDLGVQYLLPCRHNGHNMVSATLGLSRITLKDNFADKGPTGSKNNEYQLTCISLPIMLNTTFYGSRASGVYLRAGATFDYALTATANQKEMAGTVNKFGFVPFASIGWACIYDYETKSGRSGTTNLMLGPFVSYNVMNMLNYSGASLRYMTFGITYSGIKF